MRNSASSASYAFSVLTDYLVDERNDELDWADIPFMADSAVSRLISPDVSTAVQPVVPSVMAGWEPTMPAVLDHTPAPKFQEAIKGLSIREVHEPDLFKHFFQRSIVR